MHRARDAADRRAHLADAPEGALRGADAAIIATAWPDFADWDWPALAGVMRRPLVIDGRDLLAAAVPDGIQYRRVGVGYPDESYSTDRHAQRKGKA